MTYPSHSVSASFGVMTIGKATQEGGGPPPPATPAAGVVLAPEPLANSLPLQRPSSGDENSLPTTQYAMNDVAELGLLKMDFLGLTNLTILGLAVEVVRDVHGVEIDLSNLPDGDAKTYEMLSAGGTVGGVQLEGGGWGRGG